MHGEIKIDGQPLAQGSILWVPIDGNPGVTTGGTIDQGKYQLEGEASPIAGPYRVEIRAPRKTGKMVPKPLAPPGEMVESEEESIAAEFNSSSTLKIQLRPGENTHDFEVKALPPRR